MWLYMAQTGITQPKVLKGMSLAISSPWDEFSVPKGEIQDSGLFYLGVSVWFPPQAPINIYTVLQAVQSPGAQFLFGSMLKAALI